MKWKQAQLSSIFFWDVHGYALTYHWVFHPTQNSSPVTVLNESSVPNMMLRSIIFPPFFHLLPRCPDTAAIKAYERPQPDPRCHPVWLINPPVSHKPQSGEHCHGWDAGCRHSNTTEWPNSITYPIYLFGGPPGGCGSSVNLWSQSIIYSPTCPRALHCH